MLRGAMGAVVLVRLSLRLCAVQAWKFVKSRNQRAPDLKLYAHFVAMAEAGLAIISGRFGPARRCQVAIQTFAPSIRRNRTDNFPTWPAPHRATYLEVELRLVAAPPATHRLTVAEPARRHALRERTWLQCSLAQRYRRAAGLR